MSEPTPEQIVAEAMVNAGAPLVHSRVEDAVVAALRDAGKLVAASAVIPPEPEAGQLSQRIEALEGKHAPILVWTGGSAPEPSHEVCSACGEGECAFEADLRALLAEFQFVLAASVQVDEVKLAGMIEAERLDVDIDALGAEAYVNGLLRAEEIVRGGSR